MKQQQPPPKWGGPAGPALKTLVPPSQGHPWLLSTIHGEPTVFRMAGLHPAGREGPHQNKTPLFTDPSKKETCTLSAPLTPTPGAQPQCGPAPGAPMKPEQLARLCSQPMDLPLRLTLAHSRRWELNPQMCADQLSAGHPDHPQGTCRQSPAHSPPWAPCGKTLTFKL